MNPVNPRRKTCPGGERLPFQRPKAAVQGRIPMLQRPNPALQAPKPVLQGSNIVLQGSNIVLQAPNPALQRAKPVLQGPNPVLQRARGVLQRWPPTLTGSKKPLRFRLACRTLRPATQPVPAMTSPNRLPLADLLAKSRTAFTNAAEDADAKAALAPFGYTEARLDDLLDLVEDVETKSATQAAEYGEQYAATSAAEAARADLEALFGRHRQIARLAHRRGTDAYRALGLDGSFPTRDAEVMAQASTFYRMLQDRPDVAAALVPFTLDAAALAEGRAKVEAVQAADAAQAAETGDAQRATTVRDDAANRLRAAYSDFVAVAKLALSGMPQVRERLGILERS